MNDSNVNVNQHDLASDNILRTLRNCIRNSFYDIGNPALGLPVYIVDSEFFEDRAQEYIFISESKKKFDLRAVADALRDERKGEEEGNKYITTYFPEGEKHEGFNCSPVIILYKEGNETTAKIVENVYNILISANVKTYVQSHKEYTNIIKATDNNIIEKELREQYTVRYSGAAFIEQFKAEIQEETKTKPLPTGYTVLDKCLDGGLYPGLYALGGGTGSGKTTFTLNIAEHLARQGNHVLLIALEMSQSELFAKIISNITSRMCRDLNMHSKYAYQTRDILRGGKPEATNEDRLILEKSMFDFEKKICRNIFIHESIGTCTTEDIESIVKRHISRTGQKPVVFIDYLQILSHSDKFLRSNDKAKTDSNIVALKQLSRDYKLPVFVVSSLNRESYKDISQEVDLISFKESGAIEYTCDVVIGLQFSLVTEISNATKDGKSKAEIEKIKQDLFRHVYEPKKDIDIKILKNRHGEGKKVTRFVFNAAVNNYTEVGEVEPWRPNKD